MGEYAQKRIIRKLDLELFLSKIAPQSSPQAHLEQYTISESIASTMLYIAAYANNDIIGKTVLDLGCGTGRLALGASYLGAKSVVGVDVDKLAIKTAVENSFKTSLAENVQWIIGDISAIVGRFDTVLQNPPFGVQTPEADRAFLAKALEVGNSVYSLHNHPQTDKQLIKQLKASSGFLQISPSPFLERFVAQHNGVVKAVYAMLMTIPRMFDFHTKLKHDFVVDLYVIERMSSK
ncbi:MAG: METTL5 family protein [Candidatus Bathyarchaeia archaeon]|jgi:putative methylase